MKKGMIVAAAVSMMALGGCSQLGLDGNGRGSGYGPGYSSNGSYDAARDYRDGPRYQNRRLSRNDTVYRGNDGRYYCKRDDGTTGLIVGGLAGGVLGNIIAPGGSKTLGTIIGAAGGAVVGQQVDKGDAQCR